MWGCILIEFRYRSNDIGLVGKSFVFLEVFWNLWMFNRIRCRIGNKKEKWGGF